MRKFENKSAPEKKNKSAKMRKCLTTFNRIVKFGAVQKRANLVDLAKIFQTSFYLQNLASIQPRTWGICNNNNDLNTESG